MGRIFFFNYCAIPVYLIILYTTFVRRATKGLANTFFITLTIVSLLTTVFDIIADGYEAFLPMERWYYAVVVFTTYAYFILRNATSLLYFFFILSYTRTWFRFRSARLKLLITAPYAVFLIVLLTNPIHKGVYTISPEAGYIRAPLIMVPYVVSIFYLLFGTVYLTGCRSFIERSKFVALMSMYVLSAIAVLWQLFRPRYLVEMFSTAIAFLMVILLVLRPEEITDSSVGLPSWKAYKAELRKIVTTRHPVQIFAVRFINAERVRAYLGEEMYAGYFSAVAGQIDRFLHEERFPEDMYFEAPGNLYCIVDSSFRSLDLSEKQRLFFDAITEHTQDFERMGVHLDARICSLRYPEDLGTEEDIIRLGHEFFGLIPVDQTFVKAEELVGTRKYEIGTRMDSILNRAITEHGFEMYYQPIYSLSEGGFCSAEALIRLNDETYGAISPGLFIPAAESKGLILPIGDFVLESVFSFISAHDLTALGLHYIEINLSVAQCLQPELVDKVKCLQERYGVDPSQVNFEITETTYDNIGNVAEKNIRRLAEMGYSFSLDDYGTGYSNMKRVVTLPLK
ncbi:MAG TPA: hypothetical protein DCL38_02605, partial [Lachnospiraceae bacterium]|nr:hypothetical protein [Lachnospiraceae bacterium]